MIHSLSRKFNVSILTNCDDDEEEKLKMFKVAQNENKWNRADEYLTK